MAVEAFRFQTLACKGGSIAGCSYQGYILYRGLGAPKNEVEGIRLLRLGCDTGDQWGCDELAKLRRE